MTAALDRTRLENVRTRGEETISACPACREAGADGAGDHLWIGADGRFGCVANPGDTGHRHRQRIFQLVGMQSEPAPRPPQRKAHVRRAARTWSTPEAAATACTPAGFALVTCYQYGDGAAVARYEGDGKKTFRQYHRNGDGWTAGGPGDPWPLYGVENLPTEGAVYIVEGEKAHAAAVSIGLAAVTSAGGAKAASKSDWRPLAGRDLVILPDHDDPGQSYARDVSSILAKLTPPARVRKVGLPGLPEGGDIADYLDARDATAPATLRREIEALAAAAPEWTPAQASATPDKPRSDVDTVRARLWAVAQEPKLTTTERHRATAAAVVEWLHSRGRFYFHAERRDFVGVMHFDAERKLLLPVQGDAFLAWLSDALAMNRAERTFAFVQSACETEGLSERATGIEPGAFWAATPTAFYLSNGPGCMARIAAGGVGLVDNGTDNVLFPYGATLEPWTLTEPVDPFESCALFREMATAAPHGRDLFRLWATALPSDPPCKPPACVTAPVGGGKTALIRGLFRLYGMPEQVVSVVKNGEGDFWAGVDGGGVYCLDNADTRVEWLPDAAAAAATAGAHVKRRLYTDADRVTLRARAWLAITSASPSFASDAGLADRLIVVRLNRRTGETAEAALFDEIRANRDAGLSWICHALAGALADCGDVPSGLNARHPDFARLVVKIGRATGRGAEAVAALRAAEADKGLFNLENDWIGAALLELLQSGPFTGTASALLAALKEIEPSLDGKLSDKRLGKRLAKLWPHLQTVFHAEQERDGHTRTWRYTFRPP